MNEKIKQLKLEAGIQDNPDQEGLDLFSELIVRECSNIVFEEGCTEDNQDCPNEELYQLSNKIERHFGIEL